MLRTILIAATLGALSALPAPRRAANERFVTSSVCAMCHSFSPRAAALRDASGRAIAPFDLWRSSMMANATRDPLWRAVVSAEGAATPARAKEIAAKCVSCHAPMAPAPVPFSELLADTDAGQLALDGVSCTVCHQIRPEGLGTAATFSGRFRLDDQRREFGPHANPFLMPMRRHTGYTATHGPHVLESAHCATCHTLYTGALTPDGAPAGGTLAEQTPYLEWRNSWYSTEGDEPGPLAATCADCHAPKTDEDGRPIRAGIARNPGGRDFGPVGPRSPFGRHLFVGGNVLVPALLRDHADALSPPAGPGAIAATLAAARRNLEAEAARIGFGRITRDDGVLRVAVRVGNFTGHKLPTGHPTRRAWLRVRVLDGDGEVIFASGEHDDRGRITGADGRPLASEARGGPVLPHFAEIDDASEAQVFESRMADAAGRPTWLLMRGVRFAKDNRLVPFGRTEDHPDAAATAPRGVGGDPDFGAGGDTVLYVIRDVGAGPRTVEATLLYQPLGARYASEVLAYDTPEVRDLRRFLDAADLRPVPMAAAKVTVP